MRENKMYHNWTYRPANFNEDVERWAFNCKDGLRENLDRPEAEDVDTASAWADQETDGLFWEGETDRPGDWGEFVEACRDALEGEILSTLKSMRKEKEE